MRKQTVVVGVLVLLVGALLLLACDRDAGCPHDISDLEGRWVLDRSRGEFDTPPPETLWFTAGTSGQSIRISDGLRAAEFVIPGVGVMSFAAGQQFEPLLPRGAASVHTMTHLYPTLPAWDHLIFYPDGQPAGPGASQRVVVYERD